MTALFLMPLMMAATPQLEDLAALDARLAAVSDNMAGPVDKRLRLVRCPTPVEVEPAKSGTLLVHCREIGWQLHVPLSGGPIRKDIADLPLVQRGESLHVVIRGSNFGLSYPATAMEHGRSGDRIRIKTGPGGRVLMATVTGPGRVEMKE